MRSQFKNLKQCEIDNKHISQNNKIIAYTGMCFVVGVIKM